MLGVLEVHHQVLSHRPDAGVLQGGVTGRVGLPGRVGRLVGRGNLLPGRGPGGGSDDRADGRARLTELRQLVLVLGGCLGGLNPARARVVGVVIRHRPAHVGEGDRCAGRQVAAAGDAVAAGIGAGVAAGRQAAAGGECLGGGLPGVKAVQVAADGDASTLVGAVHGPHRRDDDLRGPGVEVTRGGRGAAKQRAGVARQLAGADAWRREAAGWSTHRGVRLLPVLVGQAARRHGGTRAVGGGASQHVGGDAVGVGVAHRPPLAVVRQDRIGGRAAEGAARNGAAVGGRVADGGWVRGEEGASHAPGAATDGNLVVGADGPEVRRVGSRLEVLVVGGEPHVDARGVLRKGHVQRALAQAELALAVRVVRDGRHRRRVPVLPQVPGVAVQVAREVAHGLRGVEDDEQPWRVEGLDARGVRGQHIRHRPGNAKRKGPGGQDEDQEQLNRSGEGAFKIAHTHRWLGRHLSKGHATRPP